MKFFASSSKYFKAATIACGASCAVWLFSCTAQQNQSLLSGKPGAAEGIQKIIDSVPFAYDVAVDTISYNSCMGEDLNSSNKIHGIKVGANEGFVEGLSSGAVKGGIKLRTDFLQYVAKNVPPTYPNPTVSASQIKNLLQSSTANQNLRIQVAVRSTTNLQVVPDIINKQGTEAIANGRDGLYLGGYLTNEPVVSSISENVKFGPNSTILSEGSRVYNLGSKSSPEPIQASLGYSLNTDSTAAPVAGVEDGLAVGEQYSDKVRANFNSLNYILAVTFGNETFQSSSDTTGSLGFNSPKRPNETDLKKAYGRGFELFFSSKNSALPSWRKNLLTRVTEKNLEDGRTVSGASWTCENFVIMKTSQLNNKKLDEPACAELIGSDLNDKRIQEKVKLIRRHYTEDLWAIGLAYSAGAAYSAATRLPADPNAPIPNICLVNKQRDCYFPTTGIITATPDEDVGVQYDSNFECYLSRAERMGVTYSGGLTGDAARRLGRCAQYASVCKRSSTSF